MDISNTHIHDNLIYFKKIGLYVMMKNFESFQGLDALCLILMMKISKRYGGYLVSTYKYTIHILLHVFYIIFQLPVCNEERETSISSEGSGDCLLFILHIFFSATMAVQET